MQKELLSAYMDGEQVSNQVIDEIHQDPQLQQSWHHFHLVRSVMRQETSEVILGQDFTAKMASIIEQEVSYQEQPTVAEVEKSPFVQKLRRLFMPMTQVAVAAGVCLVAVLGVQSFNGSDNMASADVDTPVLQTLPFNNNVQAVSYNAPAQDVVTAEQLEQKSKRIEAMLQDYELQRRVNSHSAQNQ
ncbi:sigma-E factor negative regulatory protein [Volucribacter amazonae]|uniref:Anti-sigma-E factor RseA n=1 Tax=Volucribacter amazonae TaxID=256731 RepID=A0A9X4SI99_9PAST|nr:sigma-E factor negative regulatory protein [Volucribacter amazonae]MDG6895437.1 transcriptional regulator [Volucribacter amazonae]